jgi:protein SDA1
LDEFLTQWNALNSLTQLLSLGTAGSDETKWRELVGFVANVASCYPEETKGFPAQLSEILLNAQSGLQPDTKKTLVHSLVLLRHREQLSSIE